MNSEEYRKLLEVKLLVNTAESIVAEALDEIQKANEELRLVLLRRCEGNKTE